VSLRTSPVDAATAHAVALKLDAQVFPVNAEKRPVTHGKDWREVSTDDLEAIKRLWKLAGGSAYIGVDCGKSALAVIDIDTPDAVPSALLKAIAKHPTLEIMSLTRGQPHHYYRGIISGRPIPGGDIKAVGGYVVCSPDTDLVDRDIADIPQEIVDLFDLSLVPHAPPPSPKAGSVPTAPYDPADPLTSFQNLYSESELEGSIGQAFLDRITNTTFPNKVKAGEHRRQAARSAVLQAALESAAGFYPAQDAFYQIEDTYQEHRDIDSNPHKRYTDQRASDYKAMWSTAVVKIFDGYYADEIAMMRAEKGLIDYDPEPPETAAPDGPEGMTSKPTSDLETPPPIPEVPAKTQSDTEESLKKTTFNPPDLENPASTSTAETATIPGPKAKPEAAEYDPKLEPDWEEATSGKPPEPPPMPTWTEDGIELPIDRRLYREGDMIGEAPKLSDHVFYGNVGSILRVYEGASEAPIPSIGSVLLPILGATLGRGVRFIHGDVEHPTNMFWCLVAPTGLGRKSTAFRVVKRFFELVEPGFVDDNCRSGYGSGQAIILDLADPAYDTKTGSLKSGREDQRVCLLYEELGSLLAPMGYEGSILSPLLRDAYDQAGPLHYSTTAHHGKVSTNHHLAISAAITPHELQTHFPKLSTTDGLGNRFCWVYTDTDDVILPDGGHVDMTKLGEVAAKVKDAAELTSYGGARTRTLHFSEEVAERWRDKDYSVLRRKGVDAGALGAMISRQTAHALRTATIYAVTDGSDDIKMGHYEAGLAWAKYSEATVQSLFGGVVRSGVANEVLAALREHPGEPTTRTGLSKAFGYHRTVEQMNAALTRLARAGFVHIWKGTDVVGRGRKPVFIIATMPRRV
jgi:Bifunctional DNA primase/polymerase, N-terminal